MSEREKYESLGGRNALMAALSRVLNDLRRFPYFGFVPEKDKSIAVARLEKAIHFMETHPNAMVLSTRMFFPEMEEAKMKALATFIVRERFHFVHEILFADYHETRQRLEEATGILYPEVLMDLRAAYNVRFHEQLDIHL